MLEGLALHKIQVHAFILTNYRCAGVVFLMRLLRDRRYSSHVTKLTIHKTDNRNASPFREECQRYRRYFIITDAKAIAVFRHRL